MAENKTKLGLAVKYRPQSWSEVIEQDAIKKILAGELKTGNLKRCLLFTGPAGCGKTTNARIFAHEIEENTSNIIEINCADHTGVDDVRTLVLDASVSKPLYGTYKIFVLDEVHMLTTQSQNALLKILEEPPAHCVYILCTTDPQKILGTILSRAFRYDFQLISHNGIVGRLQYILEQEGYTCVADGTESEAKSFTLSALGLIAQKSQGHMRDAITELDKILSFTEHVTPQDVERVLGVTSYEILFTLLDCILAKDQARLLSGIDYIVKAGMDLKLFCKNFLAFVLDINKYMILVESKANDVMSYLSIPYTYEMRLRNYGSVQKEGIKMLLRTLVELNSSLRWETNVRPVLETQLLFTVL